MSPRNARPPRRRDGEADRMLARLSHRERQVLTMIGLGQTNAEIADDLGIGHESVKTYANRLRAKLGIRGRHSGVVRRPEYRAWAIRLGLVRGGIDDVRHVEVTA